LTTSDCLYVNMSESATVVKNIIGDVRGSEGSSREYKREKSKAIVHYRLTNLHSTVQAGIYNALMNTRTITSRNS